MISLNTQQTRRVMQWATVALGGLSMGLVVYGFAGSSAPEGTQARLLPDHLTHRTEWVTITPAQILSGTTIPASTNVIIDLPVEITRITRKTLFGRKGDTVRYWGYCFPQNLDDATANARRGFPGDLFLSEREREVRREILIQQRRRTFSVFENLTAADLNELEPEPHSRIRHQLEIFTGGTQCYVMTEKSLPIGADDDGDGLNNALERGYGSDIRNQDTDGDGVNDGLEVFRALSHPTKRDSDGDGIIDGVEDANRNGRFDPGETSPTEWDTDRDGLCDGYCKVNKGQDLRGEDKNLNGIYEPDQGEFDPRVVDSDGDGVLDEHEVYLCVLGGGDDC